MNYQNIIHLLICPNCGRQLREPLFCRHCNYYFETDPDYNIVNLMPKKINLSERWIKAQEMERKFWKNEYKKYTPKLSRIKDFFRETMFRFQINIKELENKTILEVGCGPYGFLTGLSHYSNKLGIQNTIIGIDPLLSFFKEFEVFKYASSQVIRFLALAEVLPFKKDSIDIVICQNVIDHVSYPLRVLKECRRVLKNSGLFLASIHTINPLVKFLHILLDEVDSPHPHHFTHHQFKSLLNKQGFILKKSPLFPSFYNHPFFRYYSSPFLFTKILIFNALVVQSYFYCELR